MSRFYRSYEEFAREELKPYSRIGFSMDELDIDNGYQEDFLFDEADSEEEEE